MRGNSLKVFARPSIIAGLLPTIEPVILNPGERPYFLSVLGDPLLPGSITIEGTTITVLAGTALTIDGASWPHDCENYNTPRRVEFISTLGPVLFMWGPVQREWNR